MILTINEKKAMYAFGCQNREATVERMKLLAAIAPEPAAKVLFCDLAEKLDYGYPDEVYCGFFLAIHDEMSEYAKAEATMRLVETSTAGREDYLEEARKKI